MPLYNNILLSNKNAPATDAGQTTPSSSSASMKLLQDHLMSKKRSKQSTTYAKQIKLAEKAKSYTGADKQSEPEWGDQEEYDPFVPNSYEVLQTEYMKAEERKLIGRKSGTKIDPNILDVLDQLDQHGCDDIHETAPARGNAIAPPSSLFSAGGVRHSENTSATTCPSARTEVTAGEKLDGEAVAAKIMSKMGYRQGQGLGKNEQGMSTPLEVQISCSNVGRIVQSSTDNDMSDVLRQSTRVLLLKNMVGPGEVDDELEGETKEECSKYGEVLKCLIYEIPNKKVPDDEAVRIFVEFRNVESAIKAMTDLNGRYFGGRVVKASFYNVDKFNKYDLGP